MSSGGYFRDLTVILHTLGGHLTYFSVMIMIPPTSAHHSRTTFPLFPAVSARSPKTYPHDASHRKAPTSSSRIIYNNAGPPQSHLIIHFLYPRTPHQSYFWLSPGQLLHVTIPIHSRYQSKIRQHAGSGKGLIPHGPPNRNRPTWHVPHPSLQPPHPLAPNYRRRDHPPTQRQVSRPSHFATGSRDKNALRCPGSLSGQVRLVGCYGDQEIG